MRKAILLFFCLPVLGIGQNITNTLGTNGDFIIEDNSNNDVLYINPASPLQEFIFGLQPAGFTTSNIPIGQFTFLGGLLPSVVNLYTATNTTGNGSLLELIRTRGTFVSPLPLLAGDFLGGVNFGAYNGSGFNTGLSSIGAKVISASGTGGK